MPVAREIVATGGRAEALACDVADYAAVERVVADTRQRLGGLDILINNAGVIDPIGSLAASDPAAWALNIQINLVGAYNVVRAVLDGMLAAGAGTIVNVSSGAAHRPLEGWSAYCAGKAGLAMVTRSIALDGTSLTVNAVDGADFDVLLIRHTLEVTTWGERKSGDFVNFEVDTMARYAARLAEFPVAREG